MTKRITITPQVMLGIVCGRSVAPPIPGTTSSARIVKFWINEKTAQFIVEYEDPNLDNPEIRLPQEQSIGLE